MLYKEEGSSVRILIVIFLVFFGIVGCGDDESSTANVDELAAVAVNKDDSTKATSEKKDTYYKELCHSGLEQFSTYVSFEYRDNYCACRAAINSVEKVSYKSLVDELDCVNLNADWTFFNVYYAKKLCTEYMLEQKHTDNKKIADFCSCVVDNEHPNFLSAHTQTYLEQEENSACLLQVGLPLIIKKPIQAEKIEIADDAPKIEVLVEKTKIEKEVEAVVRLAKLEYIARNDIPENFNKKEEIEATYSLTRDAKVKSCTINKVFSCITSKVIYDIKVSIDKLKQQYGLNSLILELEADADDSSLLIYKTWYIKEPDTEAPMLLVSSGDAPRGESYYNFFNTEIIALSSEKIANYDCRGDGVTCVANDKTLKITIASKKVGNQSYTVYVKDAAGNTSNKLTGSWEIDDTYPMVRLENTSSSMLIRYDSSTVNSIQCTGEIKLHNIDTSNNAVAWDLLYQKEIWDKLPIALTGEPNKFVFCYQKKDGVHSSYTYTYYDLFKVTATDIFGNEGYMSFNLVITVKQYFMAVSLETKYFF